MRLSPLAPLLLLLTATLFAADPAPTARTTALEVAHEEDLGPPATVHPALFLAGDSTLADKPTTPPNPERGWGQALRDLVTEPARIVNHAVNGRSTKSFLSEGRWTHLLAQLQPGDHVLIQFGHNDQKDYDLRRYAPADTEYKDNLRRFIADVRAKNAHPLLATSVCRRSFDETGKLLDTLAPYPDALRAVAAEQNVPLLELNALTRALLEKHGPAASQQFFVWVKPGEYARYPKGREDNTHFSENGARAVAALAAAELRRLDHPLAAWLK